MARSSRRRAQRSRRRNSMSDLGARLWVAVPAIAYAILIVAAGGAIFAAGIVLLGLICLHELFRMYDGLRPVRLAGFLGLIGLAAAAHFGGEHQVLLATVAFFPLLFLIGLAMPERSDAPLTDAMALTVLGTLWVGLAIAHAILLRELPHGDGIVIDILVGTFLGDTAAYLGGRTLGDPPLALRVRPTRRSRGLAFGHRSAAARRLVRRLYRNGLGGWKRSCLGVVVGARRAPARGPLRVEGQARRGDRDAGTLFGRTAGALDRLDAALVLARAGY
jgi:phosphatidate cytidylyltransferase